MAIDPQFEHCGTEAAAAAGWDAEKDKDAGSKLERAFRTVKTQMQEYLDQGLSPREAAMRAGKDAAESARAAAGVARRNQLLNLAKRMQMRERMLTRAEALAEKGDDNPIFHAVHPEISGLNTPTEAGGNRLSTEAKQQANLRGMLGAMQHDLRSAKLLAAARSGTMDRDVARELYQLSMRDSGEPAQVGHTGNQIALKIAEIYRKYQLQLRGKLNEEGADIGDYAGYILGTSHDADLIYRAGEDQWKRDVSAGLASRTFAGEDNPTGFLSQLWRDFSTGLHLNDGEIGMADPEFTGPGNLAKRLSQGRVLHWRDADAWLDYQEKYTRGNLHDRVMGSMERGARQHALLSDWGTNPRAELENSIRWLTEQVQKGGNVEAVRAFQPKHAKTLTDLFGDLDGANFRPLRALGAKVATGMRNLVAMADLGNLLFIHTNSFGTGASELNLHGVPYLEAYRGDLVNTFRAMSGDADRQRLASLIGAGVESTHGSALSSGWFNDTLPGTMSKLTNLYFHMTGLATRMKWAKDGVSLLLAHDLALDKDKGFADLGPARRAIFGQYGITPDDWDALRSAPDLPQDRAGREYLTPDAADRSPAELSPRARTALGLKLRAYYTDAADRYVVTPNAADRRLARWGTTLDPNTAAGQAVRFLAQFHTWPMAAMRQGLGRELNSRTGWGSRVAGVMHLVMATSALAYTGSALEDFAKGREPPPVTPATVAESLARGGGLGIMGDLLFGHQTWTGDSTAITKSFAGPVLSQIPDTWQLGVNAWNGAKSGDWSKFEANMGRFAAHNAPFANVFYLRGALNYLLLDSMQEALNPGYLERHAQYVREQEGTGYMSPSTPILGMFNPTQHLQPFGR